MTLRSTVVMRVMIRGFIFSLIVSIFVELGIARITSHDQKCVISNEMMVHLLISLICETTNNHITNDEMKLIDLSPNSGLLVYY